MNPAGYSQHHTLDYHGDSHRSDDATRQVGKHGRCLPMKQRRRHLIEITSGSRVLSKYRHGDTSSLGLADDDINCQRCSRRPTHVFRKTDDAGPKSGPLMVDLRGRHDFPNCHGQCTRLIRLADNLTSGLAQIAA